MSKSKARHHLVSFAFVIIFAFVLQVFEYFGVFAILEGKVADLYLRNITPSDETHRVVTIGITDKEYDDWFNGTSPLDPVVLTGLVASIVGLNPTVIGVDVLTDWSPELMSGRDPGPNLDVIRQSQKRVVWASSGKGEVQHPDFWKWLAGAHETIAIQHGNVLGKPIAQQEATEWGVPIFPLDHDRSARRFPRTWSDIALHHSEFENTFARQIAEQHCRWPRSGCRVLGLADEVFISYETSALTGASTEASSSPAPDFSVGDLFNCLSAPNRLCSGWEKKPGLTLPSDVAVIVGGTYAASRDFYPTPAGANTPGLLINARAVEAEFRGPKVLEATHGLIWALDILFGCLIGVIFYPSEKRLQAAFGRLKMAWLVTPDRRALFLKVGATFVLGLLAMPLSYFLFTKGVLWVSWVGMLLTILSVHVIVELLRHDEPHAKGPALVIEKTLLHEEKTTVSIG